MVMIPKSNTEEAGLLIEEVMKERSYPCNPAAAARAGYEAAYREINKHITQATQPSFGDKRKQALALYAPPFIHYQGYIYDANKEMVADDDMVQEHIATRVRGWGRISSMSNPAELQDEVGKIVAEALTKFWLSNKKTSVD